VCLRAQAENTPPRSAERAKIFDLPPEQHRSRQPGERRLGERQAEAFAFREIAACPRQATADEMQISVNTLDNMLSTARNKVRQAEATLDAAEKARHEDLPATCLRSSVPKN